MDNSEDDDERLFNGSNLARQIMRIKHNDPLVTKLEIFLGSDMNTRRWRRLGCILGQNTRLEDLGLHDWDVDMARLCAGLRNNRHIRALSCVGADLEDHRKIRSLAPFLIQNPSLKRITIEHCGLGPSGVDALSNALLGRSVDTLEELSLSNNNIGDIDMDELVLSLSKNRPLAKLWLRCSGIGRRGCASLAKLLKNDAAELKSLHLDENSLDNKCLMMLADSLVGNTKLGSMSLRGNAGVAAAGWPATLKLVCDYSCIGGISGSNHALHDLGMQVLAHDRESVDLALGIDNANLLRASLEANRSGDKTSVARRKMIWSHARGNINIGDAEIVPAAMPRILSWFAHDLENTPNAHLVEYHEPPLPRDGIDDIRLGAIYRIVRSRPDIYMPVDKMVDKFVWVDIMDLVRHIISAELICYAMHKLYQCKASCYELCALVLSGAVLLAQSNRK